MSAEVNKALVRRFIQAQNEKDLAVLEEIMDPDFVDHSILPGQGTTREDYLQGRRRASSRLLRSQADYRGSDG